MVVRGRAGHLRFPGQSDRCGGGTLATGRLPERLPWAILMWYALVLGNQLNSDLLISRTGAVELGLILLSGILVAMAPLWLAAQMFG